MPRIDTKSGRDRLSPRREPYWLKLGTGQFLGLRKTATGAFWVARFRDRSLQQHYSALGQSSGDDFDQAKRAADDWFKKLTGSGSSNVKLGTVGAACEAYAANLEAEGRTAAAKDARGRFKNLVTDESLGQTRLDQLDRDMVTNWRDGLRTKDRGPAGVNRNLRTLKAALNEAVRMGYAATPDAWRTVRAFANAESSRELFLTAKQRKALLDASAVPLRDFLTALFYTAARPGELARATVADYNVKAGAITLRTQKGRGGETRERSVPLTPAGRALFRKAAKGKLPLAPLFTDGAGNEWHRVALSRAIRAAATKGKLPDGIVAYSIRHCAIAEWLSAGIDPVTVGKLAGTSLPMLQQHYHKFIKAPAMAKLAKVKLY